MDQSIIKRMTFTRSNDCYYIFYLNRDDRRHQSDDRQLHAAAAAENDNFYIFDQFRLQELQLQLQTDIRQTLLSFSFIGEK